MNRRSLLKGFAAGVAGLMVPVTVAEAAEEVSRKYWSLGAVPTSHDGPDWARWIEALEPRDYVLNGWDVEYEERYGRRYDQVMYEWGQSYYPLANGQRVTIYGREPYSDRFMNMGRREVLSNE